MRLELQQSQEALEQKGERLQEVEARSRDLYDTTTRLEAHIQGEQALVRLQLSATHATLHSRNHPAVRQ